MSNFYFFKEATAPSVSPSYAKTRNDLEKNMTINVKGTSDDFSFSIYGLLDGDWQKLPIITLPDFDIVTEATSKEKRYQVEIEPYWEIRCEIESLIGGNLTIMSSIYS